MYFEKYRRLVLLLIVLWAGVAPNSLVYSRDKKDPTEKLTEFKLLEIQVGHTVFSWRPKEEARDFAVSNHAGWNCVESGDQRGI